MDLKTDLPAMSKRIEEFILHSMKDLKRDGAVLGLSGGLDSAAAAMLCVRSLGKEKVHLIYMPERDSNPMHGKHAKGLSDHLGSKLGVINISKVIRAANTYKILPIGLVPGWKLRRWLVDYGRKNLINHNDERIFVDRLAPEGNSWMARGNAYGMSKHRLRMVLLYQYAEIRNLMVVGAANRTELMTGTFCKWGIDHCADIMPLLHVYRSQLEKMAEYMLMPDFIRNKPSDPDLYPTTINKGELLGGFEIADNILFNLENNVGKEELYKIYDQKVVDHIYMLFGTSRHMREAPYHL